MSPAAAMRLILARLRELVPQRTLDDRWVTTLIIAWMALGSAAVAVGGNQPEGKSSPGGESAALEKWFWDQYPKAVEQLRQATQNIRCRAHLQHVDATHKYSLDRTFHLKDGSFLWEDNYVDPSPGQPTKVRCRTPQYTFLLSKNAPAGAFILQEYSDEERPMSRAAFESAIHLRPYVYAACCLFDQQIDEALSSGAFKLTKISEGRGESRDSVTVEFALTSPKFWYESGRMVIAKDLGCALKEYEVVFRPQHGERSTDSATIECARWPGPSGSLDFIFPKRVHVRRVTKEVDGKSYEQTTDAEFQAADQGVVGDSQFTLSAFGIAEVPLSGRPPKTAWKWLLLLNAAVLIIAGAIFYQRQRSMRKREKGA